jgi:hypothetical protein
MSENTFPKMPELRVSKNGYEIRTEILKQAQDLIGQEFSYKWNGWEMSTAKDEKNGKLVTTLGMPEFPGIDKVLETAERMYAFVNQNTPKK